MDAAVFLTHRWLIAEKTGRTRPFVPAHND